MGQTILHVVDGTTGGDAMEMLSGLLARGGGGQGDLSQTVAVLGHRGTGALARREGIVGELEFLQSAGWADPSGWRGVKRVIRRVRPTHVQAWGSSSAAAVEVAGVENGVGKSCVLCEMPGRGQLRLMRIIDGRKKNPWTWVASSEWLAAGLMRAGLKRVVKVRAGIAAAKNVEGGPLGVRKKLGIRAADGPVLLLGGEGRGARHDVGLWCGATLQQFFPRVRVIVREDIRGKRDIGLERLMGTLPDEEMLVLAGGEMAWRDLVPAADLVVMVPKHGDTVAMGAVLHAFASGVVVAGTPVECVAELVAQGQTGLLAKAARTREMVARIEEYMGDSTLKWGLTDRARAFVYGEHSVSGMAEAMAAVWNDECRMTNEESNANVQMSK